MKFQIEVLNRQRKLRISSSRLITDARKILRILLQLKKLKNFKEAKILSLSIVLMGSRKMREINFQYRRKNYTTDVLSFPLADETLGSEKIYLGEIIICPEKARSQAIMYGLTLRRELQRLLTHGVLHLLGYDHEESLKMARRMEYLEQKILSKLQS